MKVPFRRTPKQACAIDGEEPADGALSKPLRVCFVSNFSTFYLQPVLAALANEPDLDVDFVFYSNGSEPYWLPEHGVSVAEGQTYLSGFSLFGTRIALGLFRSSSGGAMTFT